MSTVTEEPTPYDTPSSSRTPKTRGICGVCFSEWKLHHKDSLVHKHGQRDNPCSGSHKPPIETPSQMERPALTQHQKLSHRQQRCHRRPLHSRDKTSVWYFCFTYWPFIPLVPSVPLFFHVFVPFILVLVVFRDRVTSLMASL